MKRLTESIGCVQGGKLWALRLLRLVFCFAIALLVSAGIAPANLALAAGESDSFMVAAAQQDGSYILEPTVVACEDGDTVRDALQKADLGFEFTSAGTVDSIRGVKPSAGAYMYYFTDYESRDSVILSEVPASTIKALYISCAEVGPISQGHVDLLETVHAYTLRTDGVKNYPDAKSAYTRCVEGLPSATDSQAATLASDFTDAIDAYDAIMAGPKQTITFNVTRGGSAYSSAQVTMTDVYGNVTSGVRTSGGTYVAQVVKGYYKYEVADSSGLDSVRCTMTQVTDDAQVQADIPATEWFKSVTMLVFSDNNAACSTNNTSAANRKSEVLQNIVPDEVQLTNDLAIYAVPADEILSNKTSYPLYAVYEGLDGQEHSEHVAYTSYTYRLPYLVDSGPQGAELLYEVRHPVDSSLLVHQVETCRASITRSATLSGISVADGDTQLLSGFEPYKKTYDVYTSADELAFAPEPRGSAEEGYRATVNGVSAGADSPAMIAVPESARTTPLEVKVAVSLGNASITTTTYTVKVHKADTSSVVFTHETGVSVEVRNEAGGVVQPTGQTATSSTFNLLAGHAYTYVATKEQYFHASGSFTAADGATVSVATPPTVSALESIALGRDNLWESTPKAKPLFQRNEDASTLHEQVFYVPDYWSSATWLRAYPTSFGANAAYTYEMVWTRQAFGDTRTSTLSQATSSDEVRISGSLSGFTTVSGYANTAKLTVTTGSSGTGDDKVTFTQDYFVTAQRVLTLAGMGVSDGVNAHKLIQAATEHDDQPVYGFDRDVRDYLVAVAGGTEFLDVQFAFARPVSDTALAQGGYTAVIDGTEISDAAGLNNVQRVSLDPSQRERTIPVTVRHEDPSTPDATYRIIVRQMPKVTVTFNVVPEDATVTVTDLTTGLRVYMQEDGSFDLISGYNYSYTASARGYVGKTEEFMAYDGLETDIQLVAAPVNPTIDPSITSHWPYFRADANNNGVISAKTPIPTGDTAKDPLLYWATQVGEGYDSGAAGCPILVDGYLYTYAGDKIYKLDTITGEVVASGTMVGTSSFAITPMTYAEGMVFVALSNGRIEAFNASTLESLWVYTSPNGGQPNCPIAYCNGCIYTGFWNWANVCDFVCLTVTDEDPTTPGSGVIDDPAHPGQTKSVVLDPKLPLWSYPHAGGFYWAGAWAGEDYVIVGSDDASITAGLEIDDEQKASGTLLSLNTKTGEVIDTITEYPGGVNVGNIRSTIMYDPQSDRYYYCGRGGYLCSVGVNEDGSFDHSTVRAIRLQNTASDGAVSATSTPVVYNGRAYVGADHGAYNAYDGQSVDVIDLATGTVAYTVDMQGRAQTSGLLTTGYVDDEGYVYIYYIDNYTPGQLRCFKDKPGQTHAIGVQPEEYTWQGKTTTYQNVAKVVFCPQGAQAQYCICSPIADEYGTIYFKNDSAYTMAVGSPITKLEVVQNPEVLTYGLGEAFNPAGMKVVATYANGATRDVTDYVQYPEAAFTQEGVVDVPIVFPYTMYQSGASAQDIGQAPDYNYEKPATSLKVTVGSRVAPRLTTEELPVAQATDSITGETHPIEVQFQVTGAPRTFTWSLEGTLPSGVTFDETTGTLSGAPDRGSGGLYTFSVSVSNGVGDPAVGSYELEVYELPGIANKQLTIRAGEPFEYLVSASGYPPSFEYGLQEGWESSQGWISHTPEGLSIDSSTGLISGTTYETGFFHMRVYAGNDAGLGTPAHFRVTVNGAPQIVTGSLPTGVIGSQYEVALKAQGYPQPTWSWVAAEGSQLPAGLSLDSETGAITGTLSETGAYSVVITATNDSGSDIRTFDIQVDASSTAPSILTDELAQAALGEPYNTALQVGGSPTPTVTVVDLPDGLVYDAQHGAITGTPTRSGTFTVKVSAANDKGTATKDLQLVVAVPPTIATEVIGQATDEAETGFVVVGQNVSIPLEVQGSPDPTVSVTGLPAGLSYDAQNARITGVPTQVDDQGTTVTVQADNGVGTAVERTYTLFVYAIPQIGAKSLANAQYYQAYEQDLGIVGLPKPTVIVTGLASGLRYDKDAGCITGTPTMQGTFDVTVRATNVVGSDEKTFALVVGAPPSIGVKALAEACEGHAYTMPLGVAGVPAPEVTVEGLPTGLAYDAENDVISGTTTLVGTHEVTVTAVNGLGEPAVKTLPLVVREDFRLVTEQLENAVVGQEYRASLQFSKDVASVQVEGLPDGLSFDADSIAIEGVPTLATAEPCDVAVSATSAGGTQGVFSLTLVVEPYEHDVSMRDTATLFPWTKGVPCSVNLVDELQVQGRPDTFTFDVVSGSTLPAGVMLAADGTVSGVPEAAGTYSFAVICGNGVGNTATCLVSVEVNGAPDAEQLTVPEGVVGSSYNGAVSLGGYPAPVYSWEAAEGSQLPSGISLNSGTGTLSGIPTSRGTYDALVTARNDSGSKTVRVSFVMKADIANAEVEAIPNQVFTGSPLTPALSVYELVWAASADTQGQLAAGSVKRALAAGTDYEATYSDNLNAGTATVLLAGKGMFTGSKTVTFNIAKAKQPLVAKAAKSKFAVKYKKLKRKKQTTKAAVTVSKAQGSVTYAKVKVSKKKLAKKFKVNAKTGKITIAKGVKKGKYKVTIKASAAGNTNFLAGAQQVTVKIVIK